MASEASGGDAGMSDRLHRVKESLDRLEGAQRSARITSWLVTLAVALAVIVGLYQILSQVQRRMEKKEEYAQAFSKELERRAPRIQAEVDKLLKEVTPELERTLGPKMRNEWIPAVEKVAPEELVKLTEALTKEVQEKVARSSQTVQDHATNALKSELPALADQAKVDKMLGNAQVAMEKAVARVMQDHLGRHVDSVVGIETKIMNFPVPDRVAKLNNEELTEYLNQHLMAFAASQFRSSLSPEAKAYLAQ